LEEMSLEQGLEEIGHKILVLTRNELYMKMRFMDVALSAFYYVQDFSVDLLATDGETMYFNGQMLGGEYRQNRIEVNRAYLHLVLHCIFRHVFRRNGREELMWNLAADIAVESVIDDWNLQNTAEKIYGVLVRWKLSNREMERMVREFTVDDHKYWAKDEDDDRKSEMNQRWQDISEKMQTDMETFSKEAASNTGHFLDQVRVENRQRYDYRSFLRKFAVLKEEVTVDDDSFDYVFYSYGLSRRSGKK
jgi:predicted DNA-binding WGR domain protein